MATKPKVNEERVYSYREAAKILGMHWTTLQRHASKGRLKMSSRCVMVPGISERELMRFKNETVQLRPNQRKLHKLMVEEYAAGGQTMKQVAKKYGVSESFISYLVRGKRGKDSEK